MKAFQIEAEATPYGVRYCIVGTKTEQSERRIPFQADLLPYLPKTIKGRLFKGSVPAASKRLNRFLRDCGITNPRKVPSFVAPSCTGSIAGGRMSRGYSMGFARPRGGDRCNRLRRGLSGFCSEEVD